MLTLSGIWLQIGSVAFHPLDTQEGRAHVQLQLFLFGAQSPNAVWPRVGTQELLYGQTFSPQAGLFNAILPYGEFGSISFRVIAHDLNNPEGKFCITGPHGNEICFPADPMSFALGAALAHGEFRPFNGTSSTMEGEKFEEDFTLSGFVWADPPIAFGGGTGAQKLQPQAIRPGKVYQRK